VQLFDRNSRKIELTKAGRLFVPEANASLTHAECAWELARHQALLEHGPFRLGYSAYVHGALLPVLLRLRLQETETSAMVLESVSTTGMVQRAFGACADWERVEGPQAPVPNPSPRGGIRPSRI
jgi:DNA-binding transcriptional LysR family regulator